MYLVRVTPLMNFTFSDDSLFLKKNLGGGHKFSEFACLFFVGGGVHRDTARKEFPVIPCQR